MPNRLVGQRVDHLQGFIGRRTSAQVRESFKIRSFFDQVGRGMHVSDLNGGFEELHLVGGVNRALNLSAAD